MLSEKDAAYKRFSNDDLYKDIDDADMRISIDEDYLYDFGMTDEAITNRKDDK